MGVLRSGIVIAIGYFIIQLIEKSKEGNGPLPPEWSTFIKEYQVFIIIFCIALFEFIF